MSARDFQFYPRPNHRGSTVARITARRGGLLVVTAAAVYLLGMMLPESRSAASHEADRGSEVLTALQLEQLTTWCLHS